ncbi:energy transducer TonB [Vulgatibacter sp.]|uniref:energy transducer TonB family protein n=1 Tax=Vulgatibacter sp. TaxID=1971226 RepID=UPI00356754CF
MTEPRRVDPTFRRLDLLPDRYELAGTLEIPVPPPEEPEPAPGLADRLADDRAVRRATERVETYWSELRQQLERRWEVPKELLRDGPTRGLGIPVEEAWKGYREQAERYAATGNPYGEGPLVPGARELADNAVPVELPDRVEPTVDMERTAYRQSRSALVLLVQDETGNVADVRLHRSSGNAAYDRAALERAKSLATLDLGLPPDGNQSVWSFDATLITTPPLPIAGCAVDAYFIPRHCFYPLSQRVKEGVRLVGVWRKGERPGIR